MINNYKLEQYIEKFYGYGNWKSPIWFVGIEEGGGNSEEEIKKRINSWFKFQTDLIDIKQHHINIGLPEYFIKGNLQPFWKKLIRIKLSIENKRCNNEIIRDVQKNNWGQLDSDNAIIELFPLPSPGENKWFYHKWANLNYLNNRYDYYQKVSGFRIDYIKSKIQQHKPRIVFLCASNSMMYYWNKLVGLDFKQNSERVKINKNYIRILKNNNTCFVQTPHPAALIPNNFWDQVGQEIRGYLL
jgi:hypothetical protein